VPFGLGIMVAATLFHIGARVHLGKNWSSPVMIKTEHELVRTGPYRFVRHPIYTAISSALVPWVY
jgi:protein-S-isoprenylcysteine O-methyltransferase Ste14